MEDLIKQILTARVYDLAQRTPLEPATTLSARLGNTVLLKREDLQPSFSFKVRGAYNRIAHLSERERGKGVICASAGNHAQGVALSAQHLRLTAMVVMPETTPRIKVDAVKRLGAEVVLKGDSYADAAAHCALLVEKTGMTFIHPFDDPFVIAGQGTIGHELLQQCPDVDAVFVPVGGGGLIGGISAYIKALRPETRIIGVEPEDAQAMRLSLKAGTRVILDHVGIFADGVAVKQVGALTFALAQRCVDEIVTVSTDQICSAIKSIYEDTRSIMEPSGALGVAGLRQWLAEHPQADKTLVAINSGANMNFDRLQFVAERTLTGERREALFAVTIPEQPGSLRRFCDQILGERNITEFNYRLAGRGEAHIFVGVGLASQDEKRGVEARMGQNGFPFLDLTENDLAKEHIRHMVGGRSAESTHEVLYKFDFPERPRALRDFLDAMSGGWNISLFHYRMHGADFGRVLVGFEIPPGDEARFQSFLKNLHYDYEEETGNPVYRLFL